jgi:hypothetical protein
VPTFLDAYLAPISPLVNITGLDDGMHTIEISVVEDVAPNECEIDRFVYVLVLLFQYPLLLTFMNGIVGITNPSPLPPPPTPPTPHATLA